MNHYDLTLLGLKNTKPRMLVLEILNHSPKPITAEDIYQETLHFDQAMNLSTVYRTLEIFLEKELVTKSFLNDDHKSYFMMNHHDHTHFLICDHCKTVIEIEGCPFNDFERNLERKTDFTITHHRLELFGLCPNCRNKRE